MKISPEMLNQNQKILIWRIWKETMEEDETCQSIRWESYSWKEQDTYLSAFAQLKSYPFFRQATHWFISIFNHSIPDIVKLFTNHCLQKANRL